MTLSSLKPALDLLAKLPGVNPALYESMLLRFHKGNVTRQTAEAFASIPLETGVECAIPFSSFARIPFAEETILQLKEKLHVETGTFRSSLSIVTEEPPRSFETVGEPVEIDLEPWQLDIPLAAIDRNEPTLKRNLALAYGWSFGTVRGNVLHACKVTMPEDRVITLSPEVAQCLSAFLPAKVSFYENVLVAKSDKGELVAALANEGYPDFRPFLKLEHKPFATVNAMELRRAVDALSDYDQMVHSVQVQCDQGLIHLSARDSTGDPGEQDVVAQTFSKSALTLNGVNFSRLLKQCEGDVELLFGESPYPFLQVQTHDRILIAVGIVQRKTP